MNIEEISKQLHSLEEYQYEDHPSRFICVFNVRKSQYDIDEIQTIFGEYGEIKSIDLQLIHFTLIILEFYDIRSSKSALKYLTGRNYRGNELKIIYGVPNELVYNNGTIIIKNSNGINPTLLPNDYLKDLFGKYGEIKEIRESKMNKNNKFIEFYDIRSSEKVMENKEQMKYHGIPLLIDYSKPNLTKFQIINQLYQMYKFPMDLLIYIPPTYLLHIMRKYYQFHDEQYELKNEGHELSIGNTQSQSPPEESEIIEFDNDGNIVEENRHKDTIIIRNISHRCDHDRFARFIESCISHFYSHIWLFREQQSQTGVVIINDYRVIQTLYGYLHDKKIDEYQEENCEMVYSKYQQGEFQRRLNQLIQV